jgi:hypothetical protein
VPHSLIDRFALSEKSLEAITAEEIAALEQEAIEAAQDDNQTLDLSVDMTTRRRWRSCAAQRQSSLFTSATIVKKMIQEMAQRASRENAVSRSRTWASI